MAGRSQTVLCGSDGLAIRALAELVALDEEIVVVTDDAAQAVARCHDDHAAARDALLGGRLRAGLRGDGGGALRPIVRRSLGRRLLVELGQAVRGAHGAVQGQQLVGVLETG